MSNPAAQIETTVTIEKRKGGRPVDPNSMTSRAMTLLAAIPTDELKKDEAIKRLVAEIGCKETSAMTYYYTYKATLNKKA